MNAMMNKLDKGSFNILGKCIYKEYMYSNRPNFVAVPMQKYIAIANTKF